MSTHRPDLERLSTGEVAYLARMKGETARRKLAEAGLEPVAVDGRTRWWDARDALPILLGLGDGLSPQAERARLDRARAELAEHQLAERRGEYVAGTEVETWLLRLLGGFTQRVRGIGSKAGPLARAALSDAESEAIVREHVDEALVEISDALRAAGESARRRRKAAS